MVCCSIDVTIDPSSIRDVCSFELKKPPPFYGDGPGRALRSLAAMLVLQCKMDSLFREFDRPTSTTIGSWCGPRGASSEPPMETMKPGVPRVLGSGIELDADLRDRVTLHITHDQFHDAKTRPVPNGWSAVEAAR